MLIAPNIHLIPGTVGARPLYLYLLCGETRTVLLDSGTAADPERLIFPYLAGIGLNAASIDLVINTHADADHVGGNAALKRANPRLALTCGAADRMLIQDPPAMIARRYGAYRAREDIGPNAAANQWYADMLGEPQSIDWTWSGGETLRLGPDWVVEIHHTPGHSAGHLTIFDPRSRTALMGDTLHGGVGRDAADKPTFPAYTDVATYLQSVETIRRLEPELLAGCHWEMMRGAEVNQFLEASAAYVHMLDDALLAALEQRSQGATLRELIWGIAPQWTAGHSVSELELVFTFAANMQALVRSGRICEDTSVNPVRYRLC